MLFEPTSYFSFISNALKFILFVLTYLLPVLRGLLAS